MSNIAASNNNLALFCDFDKVALGVREAKFPKFDMQLVLERLLLKENIVVKNSTADLLMNNCDEFLFQDDLVRANDST